MNHDLWLAGLEPGVKALLEQHGREMDQYNAVVSIDPILFINALNAWIVEDKIGNIGEVAARMAEANQEASE